MKNKNAKYLIIPRTCEKHVSVKVSSLNTKMVSATLQMSQQSAASQSQATRMTTAISAPTTLAVPGSFPTLANVGMTGTTPIFARTGQNNNNVGQYYLRFLRHHSTRASPVTVSCLIYVFTD